MLRLIEKGKEAVKKYIDQMSKIKKNKSNQTHTIDCGQYDSKIEDGL